MKRLAFFGYFITILSLSIPGLADTKPVFLKGFTYSKPLDKYFLVYQHHYFGLLDSAGRQIVPCRFDDIGRFQDGMAEVVLNGRHGFIDQQGKLVIPLLYARANTFEHGEAVVVTPLGDVGYLNNHGNAVAPFSQVGRPYFKGRYAKAWAWQPYIGKQNRESVGEFYQSVDAVPSDYIPQERPTTQKFRPSGLTPIFVGDRRGRHYGFVDSIGHVVYPLVFEEVDETEFRWKNWVRIKRDNHYGFLDLQSRQLAIPIEYEDSQPSSYDRIWVKRQGQWGCIDRAGKLVIPFQYVAVSVYSEYRAIIKLGNYFGYVDTTGRLITPIDFDQASYYQQGRAKVYRGNKWLALDPQGHILASGLQGDVFWTWIKYSTFLGGIAWFFFYVYRRKIRLTT